MLGDVLIHGVEGGIGEIRSKSQRLTADRRDCGPRIGPAAHDQFHVRTETFENGTYTNGPVFSSRAPYLPSRTTPTTCMYGSGVKPCVQRSRLPMGESSGQNRRAIVSFTTTTRGALATSPVWKARPAKTGMRKVWKKSGPTMFEPTGKPGSPFLKSRPSISTVPPQTQPGGKVSAMVALSTSGRLRTRLRMS